MFTHNHDLISGAGAERTHLHAKDTFFLRQGCVQKKFFFLKKKHKKTPQPPNPPFSVLPCAPSTKHTRGSHGGTEEGALETKVRRRLLPWLRRKQASRRRRRSAWKALIPQGGLGAGGRGAPLLPLPPPAGGSGRRRRRPPAPLARLHRCRRPPAPPPAALP